MYQEKETTMAKKKEEKHLTVGELKEMLKGVADDVVVVACNPQWHTTDIIGHQLVTSTALYGGSGTLYLDTKNFKR